MNPTPPKSARVLAAVSVGLSGTSAVLYVASVLFQSFYKQLMGASPEVTAYFSVPLAPLVSRLLLFVVQLIFCILLLAAGRNAHWSKGRGIAFLVTQIALMELSGILGTVLSYAEQSWVAQYGALALASYSMVRGLVSTASGIFSISNTCALVAFSLVCYQAGLDDRARKFQGGYPV